jgi:hypothetical protein
VVGANHDLRAFGFLFHLLTTHSSIRACLSLRVGQSSRRFDTNTLGVLARVLLARSFSAAGAAAGATARAAVAGAARAAIVVVRVATVDIFFIATTVES